jgi:outer membrane protein assembly factor BamB/mono/diheme cytochrome c family protein
MERDWGRGLFWGAVASGVVVGGLAIAVLAGYLVGHFTHTRTSTVTVGALGERVVKSAGTGGPLGPTGLGPSGNELTGGAGVNWPTVGGDLGNTRYSSLTSITPANASKLHLVWKQSLGETITPVNFNGGAPVEVEGSPLVYNGIMYVATPQSDVVAMDAVTGKTKWRWKSNVKSEDNLSAVTTAQRGIAMGSGNVYMENSAGSLVAIDALTGETRWQAKVALPGTHLESPAVPQYYDGTVYVGVSGQEVARGHVDAFDAISGKRLWRTFLACGATDTPPASGQCPGDEPANTGGGSVWTYPAVDPKYGLVYASTANPSDNVGKAGDDKWTNSIVALSMKTGHIAWGFQGVHHDIWDYDCLTPPVLFTGLFDGVKKDGVEFTCKSDEHFELERKTGKPLLAVKEVPVPTDAQGKTPDMAAQAHYAASPTQPIPAGDSDVVPHCATPESLPGPAPDKTDYVYSCTFAAPGGSKAFIAHGINSLGGQDDDPLSYNPKLGYMYYCEKVSYGAGKIGQTTQGGSFTGVTTGWGGSVAAVNVNDNNLGWLDKLDAKTDGSCFGGTATTASGVLFSSSNKGIIYAYDAKTGSELWSYKAPDYIAAPPIVFDAGGREYVAYYVGGQTALLGGETTPHPDTLMVFSVDAPALATTDVTQAPTSTATAPAAASAPAATADSGASATATAPEPTKTTQQTKTTAAVAASGAEIFAQNCSSCHTLAAAGATGATGPNLDTLKDDVATVTRQVTNGGGAMPAFGKSNVLTAAQITAVSKYVAQVAGQKP